MYNRAAAYDFICVGAHCLNQYNIKNASIKPHFLMLNLLMRKKVPMA